MTQDRRRLGDTPEAMLIHPLRRSIWEHIQQHPGVSFMALKHALELGESVLENHLMRLRQVDLIEERRYSYYTLIYPKGLAPSWHDPVLLPPPTKNVARYVLAHPGQMAREIHTTLGISYSHLMVQLKRLAEAGLVQVVGEGQRVKYLPTPLLRNHESSIREDFP